MKITLITGLLLAGASVPALTALPGHEDLRHIMAMAADVYRGFGAEDRAEHVEHLTRLVFDGPEGAEGRHTVRLLERGLVGHAEQGHDATRVNELLDEPRGGPAAEHHQQALQL